MPVAVGAATPPPPVPPVPPPTCSSPAAWPPSGGASGACSACPPPPTPPPLGRGPPPSPGSISGIVTVGELPPEVVASPAGGSSGSRASARREPAVRASADVSAASTGPPAGSAAAPSRVVATIRVNAWLPIAPAIVRASSWRQRRSAASPASRAACSLRPTEECMPADATPAGISMGKLLDPKSTLPPNRQSGSPAGPVRARTSQRDRVRPARIVVGTSVSLVHGRVADAACELCPGLGSPGACQDHFLKTSRPITRTR
jgi:hypothetical protein